MGTLRGGQPPFRCFQHEPGHLVATIGVEELVVVHTEDATLVCSKERVQDVREVVRRLEDRGQRGLL